MSAYGFMMSAKLRGGTTATTKGRPYRTRCMTRKLRPETPDAQPVVDGLPFRILLMYVILGVKPDHIRGRSMPEASARVLESPTLKQPAIAYTGETA